MNGARDHKDFSKFFGRILKIDSAARQPQTVTDAKTPPHPEGALAGFYRPVITENITGYSRHMTYIGINAQ